MSELFRPTRRRVLGSLAAGGAALLCNALLPGCSASGSASSNQVELRFWNGFTGPDGQTMLGIIKRFNDANPDVHVITQRIQWRTYYNKLFVAGLGGRAPEVFVIHTDVLNRFARAKFVRCVDDLLGPGGLPADDFDPNVFHAVVRDGKHYAIPLDIHLMGMYYNRRLLDQAHITAPPANRDEFIDSLHRLKGPNRWGFVFTWQRTNIYSVIRQNGGDLFTPDYSATTINSAPVVEAVQFCADLILKEKLAPSPEDFDSWIGFRQGKVGMCWEGIYMLPDLKKQTDLSYGASPVPTLFKQPAAWCDSHNLCLRADLTGRKLEAAKRFVKYLSDNSLDWAAGGQIPVRKSLRQSPRFAQMYAQNEFARQIPYAAYMPSVPFVFEYQSEFDLATEKALRGTESAKSALDTAARNITKIIQRYKREDLS
ncbi:MAG TPA: ABC transporter substrate-binding protein [Tepidisphaeraceae bacterium]|nr:ABC transporter substrate-binding protein [Tepidisphaeraceae bacterium]